ncbi:MAG: flavin reductase family protein, partial [Acetobacteraceae bacterium]
EQPDGAHVYCCGPAALMRSVAAATAHWTPGFVHFEWFAAPEQEVGTATPFKVELAHSRRVLAVPADRSVLEVLRANGVVVPSSCEQGVCGTCETGVLAGEVDHRDKLLSPAERDASRTMMVCVSRARCERLVLDL